MKKIFLKSLLLMIYFTYLSTVNSQILNSGFETNEASNDHCPDNSGAISSRPFNTNKVLNWVASHGSPQLHKKTKGKNVVCESSLFDSYKGEFCAFLAYSNDNCEGIFQTLLIDKNELINISITAKGNGSDSKLIIKLKKGLSLEPIGTNFPSANLSNLINSNNEQLLLSQTLTTSWQTYYITDITAEQAFSQIWIYAENNSLNLDEITVNFSCCRVKEEYQNIINPPSTYRSDYIKAGENIDNTRASGKVIIDNSNTTIFQAKNTIILEPGFEVVNNSNFIAQIDDCANLNTEVEILKIKNTCEHEYIADVCYGSGYYSFEWNLDGMTQTEITDGHRIKFKPISGKTVILTVTDLAENSQTIKSIPLGYVPFTGSFPDDSFFVTNTFSPNGNGINDIWYIQDKAKPNTKKFAYDALSVEYLIIDRNQHIIKFEELNNQFLNGFQDKWVVWEGENNIHQENTIYISSKFTNCYNFKEISQSLWVNMNSMQLIHSFNNIDTSNITNVKFKEIESYSISPNPTTSNFTVSIFNYNAQDYSIALMDVTGKVLLNNKYSGLQTSQFIETNGFAVGIYFVKITCGNTQKTEKLVVHSNQ
jgi:hypothetical protein